MYIYIYIALCRSDSWPTNVEISHMTQETSSDSPRITLGNCCTPSSASNHGFVPVKSQHWPQSVRINSNPFHFWFASAEAGQVALKPCLSSLSNREKTSVRGSLPYLPAELLGSSKVHDIKMAGIASNHHFFLARSQSRNLSKFPTRTCEARKN